MKQWIVTSITIIALGFASNIYANDNDKAQKVIEAWFTAMENKQYDTAADFLASEFVSIHTDGIVRDKDQEIALIKKLNMKSFNLNNFKFSESDDIIIVTFKDEGSEKIDNKNIGKKNAGRMAVLQEQKDTWKIVAYANLDTIG
jgi:hypothetical protein